VSLGEGTYKMQRTSMHYVRIVAGLICGLLPAAANADAVKLKLAFLSTDQQSVYVSVIKPFIDAVNDEGHGIVEIVPYTGGQLSHVAAEQVRLLQNGAADIAWVVPGLTPDVFPDDGLFELPGLFGTTTEASVTFRHVIATQSLKGYQDFFVIGAFASEPETFHARKPVLALADLKGKKISINNSQSVGAFTAFGIQPVDMELPAAAQAIGGGTIDGASSPLVPAVDFGITKVATYHYLLQTSVTPLLLIMNRKTFDALPKAAQDVIQKYSGAWIDQRYIEMNSKAVTTVLEQLRANPARHVILPSLADQATARAVFAKVADQWQAGDPRYPALLAAVKSEVASLRSGGQ
jgi:TRAP-type C4-dicarboxylate transport system substrate-binding protein